MATLAIASRATASAREKVAQPSKTAKVRVQLDFAPRSMERLNTLKEKTESSSYAEVVKNALKLYEGLIEEVESGKQFLVRDENGVVAPYKLFL
jgi:hypothetical protein